MSELTIFNFSENNIRIVVSPDGEPWFVASDVCEALTISNHRDAVAKLDEDEKHAVGIPDAIGREQVTTAINESGLYSLILTSRKPEAKKFKKWITSEVLPSIRKTGGYQIKPMTALEFAKAQVELLERLEETEKQRDLALQTKAEIGSRREASAMATASIAVRKANALEVELDKSKDFCTIKRMQMLYHGMKFNWRVLKNTAIEMGLEAIDIFDANYGTVKAYPREVWREAYALEF